MIDTVAETAPYGLTDLSYDTRADLIDPRTGEFSCNGSESNVTWGHIWTYDYSGYYTADGTSNIPGSEGFGGAQLLQYSYPGDNLGQYLPEIGRNGGFGEIAVPEGWYNVGYDPASRAVYNNYHPLMNEDTIIPTTDRYTLYVDAAYELTPGIEVYTELLYNKRKTEFDASGQVYQFGVGEYDLGINSILFGLPQNFEMGDPLFLAGDPVLGFRHRDHGETERDLRIIELLVLHDLRSAARDLRRHAGKKIADIEVCKSARQLRVFQFRSLRVHEARHVTPPGCCFSPRRDAGPVPAAG